MFLHWANIFSFGNWRGRLPKEDRVAEEMLYMEGDMHEYLVCEAGTSDDEMLKEI